MPDIELLLNGNPYRTTSGTTLAQLLEHMGLTGKRVAVEINQNIVPRSQHPSHTLSAGDCVEVVHAIGGG